MHYSSFFNLISVLNNILLCDLSLLDVNECLRKGICSKDAKCVNTPGSYSCACNSGFEGDGKQCKGSDAKEVMSFINSHVPVEREVRES